MRGKGISHYKKKGFSKSMLMPKCANCCHWYHSTERGKSWKGLPQLCCRISLSSYQLSGVSVCVLPPGSSRFVIQSQTGNQGSWGTARGPLRTPDPFLHFTAGQNSGNMVKIYFLISFTKSLKIEPYELNTHGIIKITHYLLCSVNEARNVVVTHRCIS